MNNEITVITEEMEKELDMAYFVLNGVCWQAFESTDGVWLIRIVNIHESEKYMWLKVRAACDRKLKAEDICFDLIATNFDETTKYKYLYDTERNHELIAEVFLCKFSRKKEKRNFYNDNIHRIEELRQGNEICTTH